MQLLLNNQAYNIPTDWSEVSLGRYMQFMDEVDGVEDDLQKTLITLSSFTDAPIELLEKCTKKAIDDVLDELSKLLEKQINTDLNLVITIDGIDYGLHPNLHELKLKEFVDLDNKLGDGWASMDKVMAILYRPITKQKGDKYDIEDYDYITANKRAKIFKDNLSVNTVNGAASFFLTIATNYIATMQVYLKNQPRKMKRKLLRQKKNNLAKNMAGTV